jgi:hypothetical protein
LKAELDMDLLTKFALGVGGLRTGALMQAGYITITVTDAGRKALAQHHASDPVFAGIVSAAYPAHELEHVHTYQCVERDECIGAMPPDEPMAGVPTADDHASNNKFFLLVEAAARADAIKGTNDKLMALHRKAFMRAERLAEALRCAVSRLETIRETHPTIHLDADIARGHAALVE